MHAPAPKPPEIKALTSLRFVAALWVVALHYRDLIGVIPEWLTRALVAGGYGVTFFFVLSGFILTYQYADWFSSGVDKKTYWTFFRLRFARLYPMYVFGLLLDTPWLLLGGPVYKNRDLTLSWFTNLVGLQAWIPIMPYNMFWNTPAWSVSAEIFFYATFPFLIHTLLRKLKDCRAVLKVFGVMMLGALLVCTASVVLLNIVWHVDALTNYMISFYSPLLRYFEFAGGGLAGLYWRLAQSTPAHPLSLMFSTRKRRNISLAFVLALTSLRAFAAPYTGPNLAVWVIDNALHTIFFIAPFALIILIFAIGDTFLSRWLETRLMVQLGAASYSLYIIHWTGVSLINVFFLKSSLATHLLFFVLSFPLALLCHKYLEEPWRKKLMPACSDGF